MTTIDPARVELTGNEPLVIYHKPENLVIHITEEGIILDFHDGWNQPTTIARTFDEWREEAR